MKLTSFFAAAAAFTAVEAAASSLKVVTDKYAFYGAYPHIAVEDFSDSDLVPGLSVASDDGYVQGGHFYDRMQDGYTTWSFATPIHGFGGYFDLPGPNGAGAGLKVKVGYADGGHDYAPEEIANTLKGFWGLDSYKPIAWVGFSKGSQGIDADSIETYHLDDLKMGKYAPVPIPAALPMLLGGLAGLGYAARRRKT